MNKYYPPDYDPANIPRIKQTKQRQIQSRIMMPMSVQCTQCGEFVYKGKKFNARKEYVEGEDYLGIKRWRFYFRCPTCLQEMTFKTDPQHGGYEVEKGARRNVEPWRDQKREAEEARKEREAQERDVMKKLENKSKEGRRDHELAEVLEELRERNGRGEKLTLEELVDWHVKRKERREEEDDERRAKEVFNRRLQQRREGGSEQAVFKSQSMDGRALTIDALDFELTDGAEESTTSSESEAEHRAESEVDERVEDDRQEEGDEEARQWTRQRRELTASGLSFNSVSSDQPSKRSAASKMNEKKEGPTSDAAIMVVKKRKAEQQPHKIVPSSDSGRFEKKQREVEEVRESPITAPSLGVGASQPPVVALSSLLSAYDDNSDND